MGIVSSGELLVWHAFYKSINIQVTKFRKLGFVLDFTVNKLIKIDWGQKILQVLFTHLLFQKSILQSFCGCLI